MPTDSGPANIAALRHADLCRRIEDLGRKIDRVIATHAGTDRPAPIPPELLRLYDVARVVNAQTLASGDLTEALAACHPVVANDPSSWGQRNKGTS